MIAPGGASVAAMLRLTTSFAALLAFGGCTPGGEGMAADLSGRVERARPLDVGLMYWALPRPVGEGEDAILVLEGEVVQLEVRPGEGIAREGDLIHEGLVRVDDVLEDSPPRRRGDRPPVRYAGERFVRTDALEGVEVGARVLLVIDDYDGGYGIVPAADLDGRNVLVLEESQAYGGRGARGLPRRPPPNLVSPGPLR